MKSLAFSKCQYLSLEICVVLSKKLLVWLRCSQEHPTVSKSLDRILHHFLDFSVLESSRVSLCSENNANAGVFSTPHLLFGTCESLEMFGKKSGYQLFQSKRVLDARGPGGRLLQHISQAVAQGFIISSAPGTPMSPRGLVRTVCPGGAGSLIRRWTVPCLEEGAGGRRNQLSAPSGVGWWWGGGGRESQCSSCRRRRKRRKKEGRSRWGAEEIWEPPEQQDGEPLCSLPSSFRQAQQSSRGLPPSHSGLGLHLDTRIQVS